MAAIVMVMYQLPLTSKNLIVSLESLFIEKLKRISNTMKIFFRVIAPIFLRGF
jgi:hypothetical protein